MKKINLLFVILVMTFTYSLRAQDTIYVSINSENGMDAATNLITPNQNYEGSGVYNAYAWTEGGQLNVCRPFIKFNIPATPTNMVVNKVNLMLYSSTLFNHSGENACYVRRITEPWLSTTLTSNNQPAVTTLDQVYVPNTLQSIQSFIFDVTNITEYFIANPNENYGYRISLIDETPYKLVSFCSSENTDVLKRPKLMIVYHPVNSINDNNNSNITISPNPVSNQLKIDGFNDGTTLDVQIYSMIGQLVYTENQFDANQTLDVTAIENGFYILKITHNGKTISKKILIQK